MSRSRGSCGLLVTPMATFGAPASGIGVERGIVFEENVGHAEPVVKFVGRGEGVTLLLTADEAIVLQPDDGVSSALLR